MGTSVCVMVAHSRAPRRPSGIIEDFVRELGTMGLDVRVSLAHEVALDPAQLEVDADLYVLRSHTRLWLSLAGVLDGLGATILNPYRACAEVQDKILAAGRLGAAGIPIPRSWVTADLDQLLEVSTSHPLVVKPNPGGAGGLGIQIAHNPRELKAMPQIADAALVQEYVASTADEIKAYVIGDEVFAVRYRYADGHFTREPCRVEADVWALVRRCGEAFGLGLYGVDLLERDDGFVVIDVNYFPSYRGVPGAAAKVAAYIARQARGEEPAPARRP